MRRRDACPACRTPSPRRSCDSPTHSEHRPWSAYWTWSTAPDASTRSRRFAPSIFASEAVTSTVPLKIPIKAASSGRRGPSDSGSAAVADRTSRDDASGRSHDGLVNAGRGRRRRTRRNRSDGWPIRVASAAGPILRNVRIAGREPTERTSACHIAPLRPPHAVLPRRPPSPCCSSHACSRPADRPGMNRIRRRPPRRARR